MKARSKISKLFSLLVFSMFIFSIVNSQVVLAEQFTFKYDSAGNMVTGFNYYYEYDGFNQLKKVKENNETGRILEEYWYGAEGNRIKKVHYNEDGSKETFYYIGEDFVRKINSSGTYDANYYYFGSELVAKKDGGETLFFHPDHLGSTSLITDESGNAVEKTTYLPFGGVDEGGNEEERLYTGKEKDDTGLMYYGARYYSPLLMKFTQPDTILADVYDPQQLNRYSYARNNPYKYTDPTGNFVWVAVLIPIAIFLMSYVIIPALENPQITIPWAMDNIDNYGTGKGLAVTGAEMAAGEAAGRVIGKAAGAAFKWAKNAVSSLTRKSASDAFRSPGAMMESKTGSLKGGSPKISAPASNGKDIVGTTHATIKPMQTAINPTRVEEYRNMIRRGEKIDPIEVVDNEGYGRFIDQGHHRYVAYKQEGFLDSEIPMKLEYTRDPNRIGFNDWSKMRYKDDFTR